MAVQRETTVGILRIPLDSISHRWAAFGLAAHAVLTLAGLGWSIQHEVTAGGHETAHDLGNAIGLGLLWSFGVATATVVTTAEVLDTIMVIAHFVGRRMKAEGQAEGLAEGLAKGRAEGKAEAAAEMNARVNQLLEAHPELQDTLEPLLIHDEKSGEG